MKKILSLLLAAILTFSLAACNTTPPENSTSSTESSTTESSSSENTSSGNEVDTTKVFDESKIVFSFAAISDIHLGNDANDVEENKFKSALLQIKDFAAKNDADGIDAIFAVGDLFEGSGYGGDNTLMLNYKEIYESVFDPKARKLRSKAIFVFVCFNPKCSVIPLTKKSYTCG